MLIHAIPLLVTLLASSPAALSSSPDHALMADAALLHAALEATEPAAGDTITRYPSVLRLIFSEPIESEFAGLSLTDGTGRVITLKPRIDPHNVNALIADFPQIPPGGYLVSWRVVSADGHPVGGSYAFYAAVGPPGRTAADLLQGTMSAPAPEADAPTGGPAGLTGEPPILASLIRGASLGALLGLLGLLAFTTWMIPGESKRLGRLVRGLALVTPVLLAADFYLWLQHASPTGTVDGDTLTASFSTQGGGVYAARLVLTLLAIWAVFLVRRPGLATILVGTAALITAATGHPAAIQPTFAIPGKAIHLLAVALWSGGLLTLVFGEVGENFSTRAHRVSTIALISVIAVAVTGAVETLLFLPRLRGLFSSAYGFLVLAKLLGLAGLVAFGAWHKYRALPRLASGTSAPDSLRRSVAWETGLMSAVMITAAFLAYVSPPPPPGAMPGTHHHAAPAPADTDQ